MIIKHVENRHRNTRHKLTPRQRRRVRRKTSRTQMRNHPRNQMEPIAKTKHYRHNPEQLRAIFLLQQQPHTKCHHNHQITHIK